MLRENKELFYKFNKNFINQYNIFDIFEEKKDAFIILNFIKRHFKEDFIIDTIYKNEIKKDIKYYELEKILKLIYNKLLSFKSGDIQIYNIFYKFIKSFTKWNLNKNERIIVEETPKPKYQRRKWKRYYQLKKEIKDLKAKKRKVKKKYFGSVLEDKLNNINKEIFEKQKRLKELAEKLK